MNETINDETGVAPEVVIGPGTQLRKARERQGLDRAKMAAQLHLSHAMITALESDDFENLPGPVFVQGYLRKYARLLGVNEAVIIESYQHLFPALEKQLHGSQKREAGRELHTTSYRGMRYVTWGILLILATLLFFWWQNRVELEEPATFPEEAQMENRFEEPVPFTDEGQTESGFEEPVLERTAAPPEPMEEVAESESASQQVVEESEQVLEEIDKLLSTSDQLLSQEEERADLPVDVVEPDQVVPVTPVAQPDEAQPDEAQPGAVSKRVVFMFNDACWTEVRDRDGKLRIFGELGSGIERVLNGQFGPFSVLLGNAPEVELTIDGEVFDLKPYTRGKVARFTLDPERL